MLQMRFLSDSHRTQTCNLLIRSQMLYSIELGSRNVMLFSSGFDLLAVSAFLDAGLLAGEVAQIEDAGPADFAILVDSDAVDEGRLVREDPFDSDTAGDFADREGPGVRGGAAYLDNHTAEILKTELVTFLDLIGNGDGVTGLEIREICNILVCKCLVCYIK